LSRLLTRLAPPLSGTLKWMAPELIQKPRCQPKPSADVFSFSLLAYMMITCKEPLRGVKRDTIIELTRSGRMHPLEWPLGGPLFSECRSLCDKIMIFEADLRPTIQAVHLEVSSWHTAERESNIAVLESLRAQRELHNENTWNADQQIASQLQEGLRKVRDVVMRPLSTTRQHIGNPLAIDQVLREPNDADIELMLPNMHPTDLSTKQRMLLTGILQWNFPVKRSACCAYHALLDDLDVVSWSMKRMCCRGIPSRDGWLQCKACGALSPNDADEDGCEWCGQSAQKAELPTP